MGGLFKNYSNKCIDLELNWIGLLVLQVMIVTQSAAIRPMWLRIEQFKRSSQISIYT